MKWITRERPKIDRIACPWLITRFIDPEKKKNIPEIKH
ncbi:chromate resistance protein ChrB domain-containing protein [Chitinophaga sp.]